MAEAEFRYSDLLPTGADDTPYRLITTEEVSTVEGPDDRTFLQVSPEAIQRPRWPRTASSRSRCWSTPSSAW